MTHESKALVCAVLAAINLGMGQSWMCGGLTVLGCVFLWMGATK